MISLWSLSVFALLMIVAAAGIAALRRVGWRRGLAEAARASATSLAMTAVSLSCFAISRQSPAGSVWQNAGAFCLLLFPVVCVAVLKSRARRSSWRQGSVVGVLFGGGLAVATIWIWATLYLQGVRANWTVREVLVSAISAAGILAAGTCFGWWCGRTLGLRGSAGLWILVAAVWGTGVWSAGCAVPDRGRLTLTLVDADSGEEIAARLSIRHESGDFVVPEGALPILSDCGKLPMHNWVPAAAALQAMAWRERSVRNPFRGSQDFYTAGEVTADLRAGTYRLRIEKGPEYRAVERVLVIAAGDDLSERVEMSRWVDMPAEGWFSSDDHLHIPRPHRRFDSDLATWMQAEDIHVGNFLQMGLSRDVHITPQQAFGERSVYRKGQTLLVGGQENPRTHVLGHSIVLGARHWIDLPQRYLAYDEVFREARRQGGLSGFAHWAAAGAQDGLTLWGDQELVDFIEVLGFGLPYYRNWYEALDLGLKVVPTAGTDYPCGPTLPGRERFYARIERPLDLSSWLDAVRNGRTFVTNGPVLDLAVDSAGIGDELRLASAGVVPIRATVRFDPTRDDVERLEIVRAGEVVASQEVSERTGRLTLETELAVPQSTWVAARVVGQKVGELPPERVDPLLNHVEWLGRASDRELLESLRASMEGRQTRTVAAHTAAVYIQVQGSPPIGQQLRARQVAEQWIARLDDLADRFDDDGLAHLAGFPGSGDGVTLEDLRANRGALLEAVEAARARLSRQ